MGLSRRGRTPRAEGRREGLRPRTLPARAAGRAGAVGFERAIRVIQARPAACSARNFKPSIASVTCSSSWPSISGYLSEKRMTIAARIAPASYRWMRVSAREVRSSGDAQVDPDPDVRASAMRAHCWRKVEDAAEQRDHLTLEQPRVDIRGSDEMQV
jgi:hypothetical protein